MEEEMMAMIEQLRDEAASAGDEMMVEQCQRALDGDQTAKLGCLIAISDAAAAAAEEVKVSLTWDDGWHAEYSRSGDVIEDSAKVWSPDLPADNDPISIALAYAIAWRHAAELSLPSQCWSSNPMLVEPGWPSQRRND